MKKTLLLIICILVSVGWIDPYNDQVKKGNSLYESGKYEEADKAYVEAGKYAPDKKKLAMLNFNRGDAAFMQNKYDEAISLYQSSLDSGDKDIQKKAFLNMGNTYYAQGKSDLAAQSYINALKIDPYYQKAKENLEYLYQNPPPKKDDDKNNQDQKNNQNGSQNNSAGNSKGQLSQDEINSILNSAKNKPVRKDKGNGGERALEKWW